MALVNTRKDNQIDAYVDGVNTKLVKTVQYDSSETLINPATEEKQDDIITAVNAISGAQTATDMYGGGKNAVGTTEVEVAITGKPESIIIKADTENNGLIFIGKTGVTNTGANAITYLCAGEDITIDYDDTDNAIYVISDTAAQNVWWGALL